MSVFKIIQFKNLDIYDLFNQPTTFGSTIN